jgi:peptidoglycan/xylan/chitin deacetylase (PgdA/CDA1 family)
MQNLCGNRSSDGFAILMYHRVAERVPGVEPPTCNVSPQRLRRQLAGLVARGFEAWSLSKLVQARRAGLPIPSNAFAITFDDGYENNYLEAWPILRDLNVPATIFVATGYLDTEHPFPFDEWSAAGSGRVPTSAWRPLATDQCREMLASGLVELGAHTHSHDRFIGKGAEFQRDLQCCLDVLQGRFEIVHPTFAFPFGDASPELIEIARELGLACAVSVRPQRVTATDDVFHWGRFYVEDSDTAATLSAKLSGWYTTVAAAGKCVMRPFTAAAHGPQHSSHDGSANGSCREIRSTTKALSRS